MKQNIALSKENLHIHKLDRIQHDNGENRDNHFGKFRLADSGKKLNVHLVTKQKQIIDCYLEVIFTFCL